MLDIIKIPLQSPTVKPCIVQGDTIEEWSVEFGLNDGIDLTGATIRMQVYWNNSRLIDVSNGSGITINNSRKFTIDERAATEPILPRGVGLGDLEITYSDGTKNTLFRVEYTILEQLTV